MGLKATVPGVPPTLNERQTTGWKPINTEYNRSGIDQFGNTIAYFAKSSV